MTHTDTHLRRCPRLLATAIALALSSTAGYAASDSLLDVYNYSSNPTTHKATTAATRGTQTLVCGGFSVQNFQGTQNNLQDTHASTKGFLDYLRKFNNQCFHYRDQSVGVWAFHDDGRDNLDRWASPYGYYVGVDAALAVWHSSHGGMASDGTYSTSMGSNWANRGWNAFSSHMSLGGNLGQLGNEVVRYLFLDTCFSMRVAGGHSPARTWGRAANGIRMIFGYETTSIDSPNYGRYFWQEWNKGKSFSKAFLDASWRIHQGQAPAVVAFGSTATEAVQRRNTERLLYWGAVRKAYAAWTWYNARSASSIRTAALTIPRQLSRYPLATQQNAGELLARAARAAGLSSAPEAANRPFGIRVMEADDKTVVVESDGDYEVQFHTADDDHASREPSSITSENDLIGRAWRIAAQLPDTAGLTYQVQTIRTQHVADGDVTHDQHDSTIQERTVVFTQEINGLKVIDPEAGKLEVTFDKSGQRVTALRNSLRQVATGKEASHRTLSQATNLTLDELRVRALQEPVHSNDSTLDVSNPEQQALTSSSAKPDDANNSTTRSPEKLVEASEAVGLWEIKGELVPVYRVLVESADQPDTRPRQVIIPLLDE